MVDASRSGAIGTLPLGAGALGGGAEAVVTAFSSELPPYCIGGAVGGLAIGAGAVGANPNWVTTGTYTVDEATDTFTWTGDAIANGQQLVFTGPVVPGGLEAGVVYYLVNVSGGTFQVSLTPDGSPLDVTSSVPGTASQSGPSSGTYTANGGTNVITWTGSGPVPTNGSVFYFGGGGSLPSGVTGSTPYYVINQIGSTFQVSTTPGGSPVSLGSSGSGTGSTGGTPPPYGEPVDPTLHTSDLFVGGTDGRIYQYRDSDGAYLRSLATAAWNQDGSLPVLGLTMDRTGNLYALIAGVGGATPTVSPRIEKFGTDGISDGTFGDAPFDAVNDWPWDIVRAPNGTFFVIVVHNLTSLHLWRLNAAGSRIDDWPIASDAGQVGLDWDQQAKLDVQCDSKTVRYTDSGPTLFAFDAGTGSQLANVEAWPPGAGALYAALHHLPTYPIVVALTATGVHGPRHGVAVTSAEHVWHEEINPPTGGYRLYQRDAATKEILRSIPSYRFDGTEDFVTAMTARYTFCTTARPFTWAGLIS